MEHKMEWKVFEQKNQEIKEAIDFGAFHIIDVAKDEIQYHYTSIDSLQKIIESKTLFATEYHYLNDIDEFQLVNAILLQVLEEEFGDSRVAKRLRGAVAENMISVKMESEVLENSYYVVSFSTVQDNLTLWTEFANYGCNMGIRKYELLKDVQGVAYTGYVYYNREKQKDLLINAITMVFDHFFDGSDKEHWMEHLAQLDDQQIQWLSYSIAKLAAYYGMAMKNELYEAEKEYRLIFSGKGQKIYHRVKDKLLIPYIKVPLFMEGGFPALESITLAPLGKGPMQVRAMVQYLNNQGFQNKRVLESSLNLRY